MNRLIRFAAGSVIFAVAAFAGSWSGYLVDNMCKDKDLPTHTRKCALACAKSGYGLMTSDGKYLKFDEKGNAKALAALKATKKEKDLKAKVSGTEDAGIIHVESVELE